MLFRSNRAVEVTLALVAFATAVVVRGPFGTAKAIDISRVFFNRPVVVACQTIGFGYHRIGKSARPLQQPWYTHDDGERTQDPHPSLAAIGVLALLSHKRSPGFQKLWRLHAPR